MTGGIKMDLETIEEQLKAANVTDTFGTRKEIKALPEILNDNETIKYATSGFVDSNTVLVVCTNFRVLFIDKGLIYGIKSTEIPLDMVNGVSYSKGLMFGTISVVNGAVTTKIENVSKATASIMADTIKSASAKYKEDKNASVLPKEQTVDVVSELRELKKLVDEGILTEEEFTARKKKTLGI